MARHYIIGPDGNIAKTKKGEKLFWSDGDGYERDRETVYKEHNSIFGGSTKVDIKYDPEKGKFKK